MKVIDIRIMAESDRKMDYVMQQLENLLVEDDNVYDFEIIADYEE